MMWDFGQSSEQRASLASEVAAVGIAHLQIPCVDGLPLAVWTAGPGLEAQRPVVLLVHGATFSTLCTYDLAVPGLPRWSCSALLRMAQAGCTTIGVDLAGYGSSARRQQHGSVEQDSGDLCAVMDAVRGRTRAPLVLVGWSWGAQLAAAVSIQRQVEGLVFYSSRWHPEKPDAALVGREIPQWRTPNRLAAGWDFVTPSNYEPEVRDAFVARGLTLEPSVPTVALRAEGTTVFAPGDVSCPVLLVAGADDPSADEGDRQAMLGALKNESSRELVVAGADHNVHLGRRRDRFYQDVSTFVAEVTALRA